MRSPTSTRRRWLAAVAGTGIAGLAGCTSSRGGDEPEADTEAEPDTDRDNSSRDLDSDVDRTDPSSSEWLMTGVDLENTGYHPTASGPKREPSARWVLETGDRITSNAAVADGTVYISSADRSFYAINLSGGEKDWSGDQFGAYFTDSPAITDDYICVNNLGRLVLINRDSRENVWRTQGTELEAVGSPKITNQNIYVNCETGAVVSVDNHSGEIEWRHEINGRGDNTLAIADGTIYATSVPPYVYAIDIETQERVWETELPGTSMGIAVDEYRVYVGVQDGEAVYAFDLEDGDELWRSEVNGEVHSSIALTSDHVFARVEDSIVAVDPDDGTVLWETPNEGVRSNLSLADGVVYTRSNAGLNAFNMDTGDEMWELELDNLGSVTPTVVDGMIIVGDRDGNVYAFE